MPYNARLKLSQSTYEDFRNDLLTYINNSTKHQHYHEAPLVARALESIIEGDKSANRYAHALFTKLWMNTDLDDSHPRFHDGVMPHEGGSTTTRFAAMRLAPFRGRGYWVDRLYKDENLTDDNIAATIKHVIRNDMARVPADHETI